MNESSDVFIVKHTFFQEAKDEMQLCFDSFGCKTGPRCTSIIGPSGCGKTTMIDDFIESLPPPENPRHKLVTRVETPSNPTLRALASEVLISIGDPMYYRGSEALMTNRIINLFEEMGTQLLIFDELHGLIDKKTEKLCFDAADWIKRLINKAKMPTVFVGLERIRKIFILNEQLRRRFKNPYVVEPFDWKKDNTRLMLKGFLMKVQQKYSFEKGLQIDSHEMAYRFYCATGGLVGYLMEIIRESRRYAKLAHSQVIGLEHLAQAYRSAVCGNNLVGVNPLSCEELNKIHVALKVIEENELKK